MPTQVPYTPQRRLPDRLPVSPSQGDGGVGQAAGNLAKTLQNSAALMQSEHDTSRAKNATNEFRAAAREKFAEFKRRKGGDANGATAEYQKWYDNELKTRSGTLGNANQQTLFGDRANAIGQSDLDNLSVHEANEHRRYRESTLAGSVATWHAEVQMKPSDQNLALAEADIRDGYGDVYSGIDKTADIQKQVASVYVSAIQSLSDTNPAAAAQKLEQWKDKLGGAYFTLKKGVKTANTKAQSQIAADLIMGAVTGTEDQLKKARQISDPEVRDATVNRVKVRQQEQKAAAKEMDAAIMNSLTDDIMNAGNYEAALDIAAEAEGANRKKLTDIATSVYRKDTPTDFVKYAEALEAVDRGQIANVAQLAKDYRASMTAGDYAKVQTYFTNGGNVGGLKDTTVRSIFKQYTDRDPNKAGSQLYHKVWDHVAQNLEPGKKPTNDQVKTLVAEALEQGEQISGSWIVPDWDMTYVEAQAKGVDKDWLPTMDDDVEEAAIVTALQKYGKKVTDRNKRLYKKHVIMKIPYGETE